MADTGTYKNYLSIGQTAEALGVSIDTIRRWDKQGIITSERLDGKNRYFHSNEIDRIKQIKPLTLSEAAEKIGISIAKLRLFEKQGLIGAERNTRGERVFHPSQIDRFLNTPSYPLPDEERQSSLVKIESEYPPNVYRFELSSLFQSINFTPLIVVAICLSISFPLLIASVILKSDVGKPHSASTPTELKSQNNSSQSILAEHTQKLIGTISFNIPTVFKDSLTLAKNLEVAGIALFKDNVTVNNKNIDTGTGSIFGSNILYSASAGAGLSVTGTQDLTITNTDTGSAQKIYKNIKVGSDTISAGSNTDTLELAAGTAISLSSDTTNKKITITGTSPTGATGWTDDGTVVRLSTSTDTVGIGTTSPSSKLDVLSTSEQFRILYDSSNYTSFTLSSSGDLTFNPTGGDIIFADGDVINIGGSGSDTAYNIIGDSSSGASSVVDSDDDLYIEGNIEIDGTVRLNNVSYTFPSADGSSDYLLSTNGSGTLSWISSGGTVNFWQRNSGALSPFNITDDLLIGATSTSSAKFAVINMIGSGTPTASVSANSGNNAAFLTGAGNLATTNMQNMTIGGSTTGGITIDAGVGSITLSDNLTLSGTTITASSLTTITGAATAIDFTEFDVSGSTGSITINDGGDAGNISIEGTILDINSLDFTAAGSITTGGTGDLTLDAGGSNILLSDALNAGGAAAAAYNFFASDTTGASTPDGVADLYVQDELEVDGTLRFNNLTYTFPSSETAAYILQTNGSGTLSWIDPAANTGYWAQASGALYPNNSTVDLLVGATATTSAKFAVLNVNSGNPTASVSAQTGNQAVYIDSTGTISTTAMDALTIGGSTTGGITIDAGVGSITLSDDTVISGDLAVNAATSADITSTTTTATVFNATVTTLNLGGAATTLNLADSTATKTIDIGGVTSSGTDTINISTEGTASDTIVIGNTNASTTLALTGGDDWSMAATGVLTLSASAAQTTAIVVTDTDYTNAISLGDNVILGTTAAIDFSEFDVSATTGSITINDGGDAGNISIEGTILDINSLDFTAAGSITTGGTGDLTLDAGGSNILLSDALNAGGAAAAAYNFFASDTTGASTPDGVADLYVQDELEVDGTLRFNNLTYTFPSSETAAYILQTNGSGTLSWVDPAANTGYWAQASGALYPNNATVDLLIGATATTSADFAFINVNSGNPTASISGNLALVVPTGANPATKLDIFNGGTFGIRTSVGGGAGLTQRLTVLNNGNVGIGSADLTPDRLLHVASATSAETAMIEAPIDNTTFPGNALLNLFNSDTTVNTIVGLAFTHNNSASTAINFGQIEVVPDNVTAGSETGFMRFGTRTSTSSITEKMRISAAGNVGIGDLTPTEAQLVLSSDIFVGSFASSGTAALCWDNAGGSLINDCSGTPVADYAELYPVELGIDYGEIVALNPTVMVETDYIATDSKGNPLAAEISKIPQLTRATRDSSSSIIGITSPNWNDFSSTGHGLIKPEDNPMPVALAGRVPVKVSLENGPIAVGDPITSSSIAGVGMKATKAGPIVGRALESSEQCSNLATSNLAGAIEQCKIMVFVNLSWYDPTIVLTASGDIATIQEPVSTDATNDTKYSSLDQTITEQNATITSLLAKVGAHEEQLASISASLESLSSKLNEIKQFDLSSVPLPASSSAPLTLENSNPIFDTIILGTNMSLTPTSISTLGEDLQIQPLKMARVSFMDGLVVIDTNGDFTVEGNAIFAKDVEIQGVLSAHTVKGLDGNLEVSGSARFDGDIESRRATFEKINFVAQNIEIVSDGEINTKGSAGSVKIKAGTTEIKINNPGVTKSSLIFVTPKTETGGKGLFVKEQKAGEYFVIGIDQPMDKDIDFNFLIVN